MSTKTIRLKPYYGKLFLQNNVFTLHTVGTSFMGIKEQLSKHGIKIDTIDVLPHDTADLYLYADLPYPWQIGLWLDLLSHTKKNILLCFESPLINPFNHMSFLYLLFRRVFTWNDKKVDNKKIYKFNISQITHGIETVPVPFLRKKFLVLINSNKYSPYLFKLLSPFKIDLYHERIRALTFYEKTFPDYFDLYGRDWTQFPKTYRGPTNEKWKVLSQYKFCLCFENCVADGYITEKIFDCFKAGCVPVYYGAPNIDDYIRPDCFIDFRKFSSYEDLTRFLLNMDESTYIGYLKRIQELLSDKMFTDQWFEQSFENLLVTKIWE